MSTRATMIDPERQMLGEVEMVGQDRWEEIHRRAGAGASIRAIARELDVDRKTVRRCLRQTEWKPYQRAARADTLLATHASYLRRRAADVGYSAQVLFQELGGRQYEGSYETVKRFVRPLREMQLYAAVTRTRFETPPGLQSQIDWGQARVWLGAQRQVRHIFVLTLGYSRRSVHLCCLPLFVIWMADHPTFRANPPFKQANAGVARLPLVVTASSSQVSPYSAEPQRAQCRRADWLHLCGLELVLVDAKKPGPPLSHNSSTASAQEFGRRQPAIAGALVEWRDCASTSGRVAASLRGLGVAVADGGLAGEAAPPVGDYLIGHAPCPGGGIVDHPAGRVLFGLPHGGGARPFRPSCGPGRAGWLRFSASSEWDPLLCPRVERPSPKSSAAPLALQRMVIASVQNGCLPPFAVAVRTKLLRSIGMSVELSGIQTVSSTLLPFISVKTMSVCWL